MPNAQLIHNISTGRKKGIQQKGKQTEQGLREFLSPVHKVFVLAHPNLPSFSPQKLYSSAAWK